MTLNLKKNLNKIQEWDISHIPERHKDSRFWHVSTSLQRNVGRANMVYNIHALHQKPGLLLYVHVLREEERAREPKCKVVGKGLWVRQHWGWGWIFLEEDISVMLIYPESNCSTFAAFAALYKKILKTETIHSFSFCCFYAFAKEPPS